MSELDNDIGNHERRPEETKKDSLENVFPTGKTLKKEKTGMETSKTSTYNQL